MPMTNQEFKERGRALSERKIIEGERSFKKLDTQRKIDSGKNIFTIVIGVLLLAALIRIMSGNSSLPTFSGFLEILSDAPNVQIPFLSKIVTDLGDWGLFNFLRDFIEAILSVFDVLIFLVNGLMNLMTYVVYFMQWLFLG